MYFWTIIDPPFSSCCRHTYNLSLIWMPRPRDFADGFRIQMLRVPLMRNWRSRRAISSNTFLHFLYMRAETLTSSPSSLREGVKPQTQQLCESACKVEGRCLLNEVVVPRDELVPLVVRRFVVLQHTSVTCKHRTARFRPVRRYQLTPRSMSSWLSVCKYLFVWSYAISSANSVTKPPRGNLSTTPALKVYIHIYIYILAACSLCSPAARPLKRRFGP